MSTHLILDANNLIFRARHACFRRRYKNVIIHTFFRSLKPIIEKFGPDYVYFVLDGKPKKRLDVLPDYKGNRTYHDEDNFGEQRKEIISIIRKEFPFVTTRHPEAEADDVIAHLCLSAIPSSHKKIIVSSDTDFIQLCQDALHTQLYNPISKGFRDYPDYPYAVWKAFRGDSSDNISGIRGIGNKRAAVLASDKDARELFFTKRPEARGIFERNIGLISLAAFDDTDQLQVSFGQEDMSSALQTFTSLGFKSMISPKAWEKFSLPFKGLKDAVKFEYCPIINFLIKSLFL